MASIEVVVKHSLKGARHGSKQVWRHVEKKGDIGRKNVEKKGDIGRKNVEKKGDAGRKQLENIDGRQNEKKVISEKKGSSYKGQADGLVVIDEDPKLDIGPRGELKDKNEGGKTGMEMIGKSKKPPIDQDLMAFVLNICPLPPK